VSKNVIKTDDARQKQATQAKRNAGNFFNPPVLILPDKASSEQTI
jgi:hypothetical protein